MSQGNPFEVATMSFFAWLSQKFGERKMAVDVVWQTREARSAAISARVAELTRTGGGKTAIILVAHFPDRLSELESVADRGDGHEGTAVALASNLNRDAASALDETHLVEILVAERHPLRSRDEQIVEFAQRLLCKARVTFHLSLEDALLRTFSGDNITNILRKLGMRDDESIESAMVSRRIRAAQRKIDAQMGRELPASSAAEWIELNAPSGA